MTAVGRLMALCRRFEGKRLKAYLCPAGVWTIGYGHTGLDVYAGQVITEEEAERLLLKDANKHLEMALLASPSLANETPGRVAAIADFVFNLGPGRYRASTLKRRVDAGRWDLVPVELRKWVNGGGRKLPGLVLRREAEINLLGE